MSDSGYESLPGEPTSLWLATTPQTDYPTLARNDLQVDVAIIGGGLVGITVAALLSEAGLTVAVLEAGRIVNGVTGHTTAKLTSLHTLIYDHLARHSGEWKAKLYADANQAAIEFVANLVQKRNIACDFTRTESYTYTTSDDEVKHIEAEQQAAIRLGLPATLTTETSLPFPVKAAVRFDNQAFFHPRKYLLALAQGIPNESNYIFEGTRVLDVDEGEPCVIKTEQGILKARDVIIASHFPAIDKALYFARMTPHRSYVLGVRLNGPVPRGMYISSNEPFHSIRSHIADDGGEILMVGGEGHKTGQGGDTVARYKNLETWARETFPVADIAYRWSTQDNKTLDRVPYIGLASPASRHLYVATGFGGWGMTGSTVAAMLLRDLITRRENPWAELYDPNRFNLESVPTLVKENVNAASHLIGDRFKAQQPEEIAPGEGAIVESEKGKIALFKEENGTLHRLSPVCTHVGCFVGWNPAEKSWDCPCHGSRFSCEGVVLHGPAQKNLERLDSVPVTPTEPLPEEQKTDESTSKP
jgi:glycine/D-amino acid oxidase-like deaminating enzyme/nitrite reductase/ring-hydroxylating ferredoxin subunit